MLIRALRFFRAPRIWRVVALLILGVLLSAAAFAYKLPQHVPLSRGFQPTELVGVYEIAAPQPGVYVQLSADGAARVEFLDLEDTGNGLRATAGEKRKVGWWWVEKPAGSNPLTALFERPRLCEQFKAANPPHCRAFERDAASGDLIIGDFGPFGRRGIGRYNRRTVRQAEGGMWSDPTGASPVTPSGAVPAAAPAAAPTEAPAAGADSSRAGSGGSK